MTDSSNRRAIFLDEMGVGPVWTLRRRLVEDEPAASRGSNRMDSVVPTLMAPKVDEAMREEDAPSAHAVPLPVQVASDVLPPPVAVPVAPEVEKMDWPTLQDSVAHCMKCGLCSGRSRTVFGVGDEKARWLFIGEGPESNEDMQGEPFVGPAGKLLDNMLLSLGLRRDDGVYIAHIVKCRAADDDGRDRSPSAEEVAMCLPYLKRQIALIRPTILVALGKTAALSLLGLDPDTSISRLRGKVHRYGDLPLVVTYPPAYLLRNLPDKKKAWEDLSLARAAYAKAG